MRTVVAATAATAATVVPLTLLVGQAAQAASTPSSSLDLSDNPVLASTMAGYSVQEGGSGLSRVSVTDHVAASWAARTTSTAATTRIREPREPVKAGETWTFASDVKARAGARAQITVSWFNSSGAFLSWSGGSSIATSPTSWNRVAASLKVPAGAAVGETVVNVSGSATNAPVMVTQHDVRAPTALRRRRRLADADSVTDADSDADSDSDADAVAHRRQHSSMQPPAGATLVRDLTRRSSWITESGANVVEIPETGPHGEVVLRNTLVDGQTGASSGVPSERSDLQGGTVPLGSTRWMIWDQRFTSLPTTNLDRWQVAGPNEIHGETLDQATVMPEISATKRFRLNANAGCARRPATSTSPRSSWVSGTKYKFGIDYTQGGDGWIELWRDGVRVMRMDGPTTSEARDGYWKFGNYRNADINGTTTIDISGSRVYGQ